MLFRSNTGSGRKSRAARELRERGDAGAPEGERLNEVKEVLTKYFSQKLDDRLNDLWDSGVLNQEKLDELRKIDVRTLPKR